MSIYLDYAASTPMRPEVRDAWVAASEELGNPSSIHAHGQSARRLLEESRERLAAVIDCDPVEVVLTSGGTEAVNLAVKGLWWGRATRGESIVLPDAEHHATIDPVEWLGEREGASIHRVPVDEAGRIDLDVFTQQLPGAAFATALAANNEVGTLNPVGSLAAAAASEGVPLHLDAIAAFGHVPVSFRRLRADAPPGAGLVAMSVSAHKVGAPVGVGALVVTRSAKLSPVIHGGGQQRGIRSGTQDVAGAYAFALAAERAAAELDAEALRLSGMRDRLVREIRGTVPGAQLLGDPCQRLPGNAHFLFPGARGETLLFLLDMAGISVSTGSACQAGVPEPSHVVLAMGRTGREASEVLRITMGRSTTDAEIDAVLATLPAAVERARAASGDRSDTRS